MRLIAKLGTAAAIQLGNAARHYAAQLDDDADTFRCSGADALAVDAESTAEMLRKLADDIDCDPIEIRVTEA